MRRRDREMPDSAEKARSLSLIMEHASGRAGWPFPERLLDHTAVFTLTVRDISCKAHP